MKNEKNKINIADVVLLLNGYLLIGKSLQW